jgi:hypothetical protein
MRMKFSVHTRPSRSAARMRSIACSAQSSSWHRITGRSQNGKNFPEKGNFFPRRTDGHRRAPRTPKTRNYPRKPLKLPCANRLGPPKVRLGPQEPTGGSGSRCPVTGVKQTSRLRAPTSEFDPTRTSEDRYSITSSATASNAGGMSRPSALAVLRLMVSSYLVGCCTGKSAGFSPLRIRSTYDAAR